MSVMGSFKNLNSHQKGGLMIAAGSLVVLVILMAVILSGNKGGEGTEKPQNAFVEIQDAEAGTLVQSKDDAYRRGGDSGRKDNIDKYWDDLLEEGREEKEDGKKQAASGRRSPDRPAGSGYMTEDDILESVSGRRESRHAVSRPVSAKKAQSAPARPVRTQEDRRKEAEQQAIRMYQIQDSIQRASAAQKAAVAARAEPDTTEKPEELPTVSAGSPAPARKASVVSSLDGWDDAGGIVSSLDDVPEAGLHDSSYPFKCIIVRESKIRNGERVAVRVLEDMVVGGLRIPKNTHLMATATIGERLFFSIANVEIGGRLYPLGYDAYDSHDGTLGIYCPDLTGETTRQVKDRGLSTLSSVFRSTMQGRVLGEIIDTGVNVARTSSGSVTVTVPAGYPFYIVSNEYTKNYKK